MSTPKLNEALAKAQATLEHVAKDKTAKVRMKAGGEYSYKYADLASVLDVLRKPLTENGLCLAQIVSTDANGVTVTTRLGHVSGEEISGSCWLPVAGDKTPQTYGSAITYARRYGLSALVGLASEDDDGSSASNTTPQPRTVAQAPRTAPVKVAPANEPPPHGDADAPWEDVPDQHAPGDGHGGSPEPIANTSGVTMSFGSGKGKPLSALTDKDLNWYRSAVSASIRDPAKAQYAAANTHALAALDAEIRRRGGK